LTSSLRQDQAELSDIPDGDGEPKPKKKAGGDATEFTIDDVERLYRECLHYGLKRGRKPGWAYFQCRKYHPELCGHNWRTPDEWVRDAFTGDDAKNVCEIAGYLLSVLPPEKCTVWLECATGLNRSESVRVIGKAISERARARTRRLTRRLMWPDSRQRESGSPKTRF
jgi:hypothetical protein